MDMGHAPGIACSVRFGFGASTRHCLFGAFRIWGIHQALLDMISWAMDIRQTELQNATVEATYVRHFRTTPLGEAANMHGYLSTGLCALQLPRKIVLIMARFRLSGHKLRIETGRHEGLPGNERSCCRCKRLLHEDFVAPIDDEEHLWFSCESTSDIRLRFAGLPMSSLRNLMQCEDVGSVAWFVHKCMERVDNIHAG
jgi:hypothetical protein